MKKHITILCLILFVCLTNFYAGYLYAWVFEMPKADGGVLFLDGWLRVKMHPRIPIPWYEVHRTARVDDYWILREHEDYVDKMCLGRYSPCYDHCIKDLERIPDCYPDGTIGSKIKERPCNPYSDKGTVSYCRSSCES